jgi:hypothetical protein
MKSLPAAAFRFVSRSFPLTLGLLAIGAAHRPASPPDAGLFAALRWRNIGPFRAGRVTAVTGAIGQPGVFCMGLPIGGVWKTTSAGVTWFPVFDSIKEVSSIGAVEVAPSDPNVIYVGTGKRQRGRRCTDTPRRRPDLAASGHGQDSRHPLDARRSAQSNLVLMGVLGTTRTADDNRGVFRSTDGGKSWTRTLFVDSTTGVQQLASALRPSRSHHRSPPSGASAPEAVNGGGGGGAAPAGGRGGRGGTGGPAGVQRHLALQVNRIRD